MTARTARRQAERPRSFITVEDPFDVVSVRGGPIGWYELALVDGLRALGTFMPAGVSDRGDGA